MALQASSGAKQHDVALRLGAALQEACPQVGVAAARWGHKRAPAASGVFPRPPRAGGAGMWGAPGLRFSCERGSEADTSAPVALPSPHSAAPGAGGPGGPPRGRRLVPSRG